VPYALLSAAPSRCEKNYMCPLNSSRPLSQRKVYVKIREMCQNTAQSMSALALQRVSDKDLTTKPCGGKASVNIGK